MGPHVLRRAALADAGRIADVLDECTRYYLDRPSSRDDALSRLRQGDPAEDFRIAVDSNAKTLGFGHVWEASPRGSWFRPRATVGQGLGVSGVGPPVEQRAGAIAGDLHPDAVLTLTHWAKDTDAAPVLENAGFVPIRHFLQMRIDFSIKDLPRASWPDDLELRSFSPGRDETELFAAFREAFAEHWGDPEVYEVDWWTENRDAPNAGFDPTLWFVASDGATIAGFSICRKRAEDAEDVGWLPPRRPSTLAWTRARRSTARAQPRCLASARAGSRSSERRYRQRTGALRLYGGRHESVPAFTIWSKRIGRERA